MQERVYQTPSEDMADPRQKQLTSGERDKVHKEVISNRCDVFHDCIKHIESVTSLTSSKLLK